MIFKFQLESLSPRFLIMDMQILKSETILVLMISNKEDSTCGSHRSPSPISTRNLQQGSVRTALYTEPSALWPLLREETNTGPTVPFPSARESCQLPAHSNTPSGEGSGLEADEHFRIVSCPQVILQSPVV